MSDKLDSSIKPLKRLTDRSAAKQSLFFVDGFHFGCGFFTAGFIFFAVIIPLGTVLVMMMLAILGNAIR